mgnify:CR=1 FL=1
MKKLMALLLSLVTVLSMTCVAFAGEMPTTPNTYPAEYEYFDDGSYMVTIISNEPSCITSRSATTVTKSKTVNYYSSSNDIIWYVKVTGSFKYGNGSASCLSSNVSAGSNYSNWKISNKTSSKSGSTAKASATAKQYSTSGILINTINKSVTLTCDSNGKFS